MFLKALQIADELGSVFDRHPGKFISANQLIRKSRALQQRDKSEVYATLGAMRELGMVEVEKTEDGAVGRPTERYRYVG